MRVFAVSNRINNTNFRGVNLSEQHINSKANTPKFGGEAYANNNQGKSDKFFNNFTNGIIGLLLLCCIPILIYESRSTSKFNNSLLNKLKELENLLKK